MPATFERLDVEFPSDGLILRAWHYKPLKRARELNACVIMVHGMNLTREASLEPYARAFVSAGLDILLFDYAIVSHKRWQVSTDL